MVQYKRKPVKFDPVPPSLGDDTEVWVMEATGEVYTDYEEYLSRRDFYMQKRFTCESTGHQGYTYFEALESEAEASKEINSIFPEGLRSRVLQFVQFRNTARMDDLVNMVFDHFREHYMVGDRVLTEHGNARHPGVIADIEDNTARLQPAFAGQPPDDNFRSYSFRVALDGLNESIVKYKAADLSRDRRVYSKIVLKQFLKSTVTREPWNGSPWLVKEHLAKRYDINTKVPEAKTRDAVMAAKKANTATTNNGTPSASPAQLQNGTHPPTYSGNPQNYVSGRPLPGHPLSNFVPFTTAPPPYGFAQPPIGHFPDPLRHPMHRLPFPVDRSGPPAYNQSQTSSMPTVTLPPHLAHLAQNMPPPGSGLPISLPFQNNFMQYQTLAPTNGASPQVPQLSRPFEPVKYPTEDLRIRQPRNSTVRPTLKFFSDDVPHGVEPPEKKTGVLMKSVGPLLCSWETLNVHDTIYSLDSFTLDDFVNAMRFNSEDVECELLTEIHCAVLKQIVNESGKLLAPLPRIEGSEEEEEEDSSEESEPEPEPEPPIRATRSSLRRSEANSISKQRTPTPEPPRQLHQAADFLTEFDWIGKCKARDFREGGWQAILVGLLHALSFSPVNKDACDEILAELVPAEEEPSVENIVHNYTNLDVNLRASALELALRQTVATEGFRDQLVAASLEMTRLRKEKIEHQKRRKELADDLFKLDNERKIQLPHNMPISPTDAKENQDVSMTITDDGKEDSDVPSGSEEAPVGNRKLRHTGKNKRKAQAEAVKKEKAKKAKVDAAKTKQQQEWEKLLAAIEKKKDELRECEASITELDDDLRETLVHRSKVIGKDRFLNKYYWFEHNGMPFGGVPNSSTAEYGYANGRLWVQGPDEYELQPNLEEPALSQDMEEFGFTVPQRKEKEEGSTHLAKSTDWGYYDDPEDLDKLIAWLDDRGLREKALRKELLVFRDRIAEYMIKMKDHLNEMEEKLEDTDDVVEKRVSTRNKTYIDKDATKDRCLLWTNSIMRDELGYNHSEEYEPPKKTKKGVAKSKSKGRKSG